MNLINWIKKNVPSYKLGAWADKIPKNLYVIGECLDCVSYSERENVCPSVLPGYCDLKSKGNIPPKYGCIYFKKR